MKLGIRATLGRSSRRKCHNVQNLFWSRSGLAGRGRRREKEANIEQMDLYTGSPT